MIEIMKSCHETLVDIDITKESANPTDLLKNVTGDKIKGDTFIREFIKGAVKSVEKKQTAVRLKKMPFKKDVVIDHLGIGDGAFSKSYNSSHAILGWLNNILSLNLTKIE